jgi:hypothetical protein
MEKEKVVSVELSPVYFDGEKYVKCDKAIATQYSIYFRVGTEEENFAKWVIDLVDIDVARTCAENMSDYLDIPLEDHS